MALRKIFWPVNICGVIEKISKIIDQAVWFSFLALAVVTPLIFSTKNSELFEVPKMHFVYLLATVILFLTLIKFILQDKILIPKNLVLITFLIFIAIQIISTFFSIDKFTSIFGYPSRLNGGLLSQFAYLLIFATALVNLSLEKAKKLIIVIVLTALAVSLWGIPAHFGRDPSCLILTGKLNSTCWQKDFDPQLRIFSTLGQPNWLASYLVIILPFSIALAVTWPKKNLQIFLTAIGLVIFMAQVLTNSRAGLLGFVIAAVIFLILLGIKSIKQNARILSIFAIGFLAITVIFGTTLFSRIGGLLNKNSGENQMISLGKPTTSNQVPGTSNTPTESWEIRLIVWQGAAKAFSKRPILGWGPETFAYSYYLFRPLAHNNTTEWNFFYNKAHNEFLNYLANIGLLGTETYLALLVITIWTFYKTTKKNTKNNQSIFAKAAIASIMGYQATIFFGFSTVATQLIMFLLIACVLILTKVKNLQSIEIRLPKTKIKYALITVVSVIGLFVLTIPIRFYFADLFIEKAKKLDPQDFNRSLIAYSNAVTFFPTKNPFYLSDAAYTMAIYATTTDDSNLVKQLVQKSDELARSAIKLSPNNLIIARRLASSYLLISQVDQNFGQNALLLGQRLIELAPTDPQSYLSLAKIQTGLDQKEEAKKTLQTALNLKPDYQEAQELLEQLTTDN